MFDWQSVRQLSRAIRARTDLTHAARNVASVLLDHLNTTTGQCNPSRERLMREAGASKNTVCEALALLEEKNVIVRKAGGGATSSSYSFPSLAKPLVDQTLEGVEIRPGPKSDPVRFLDARGSNSGIEGVNSRLEGGQFLTPNKEQNKQRNKEQNTSTAPRALAKSDQPGGWSGFFEDLEVTFRAAGYEKTPADKGRSAEWQLLGYKRAICLSVIRDVVSRNKTIKVLAWFDKPLEKAHERIASDSEARAAGAAIEQERIYVGTPEAKAWKEHDEKRGGCFNPFMRDPANVKKYALRPTRWPPGYDPGLKDAGHVAAELDLIAQGRGR